MTTAEQNIVIPSPNVLPFDEQKPLSCRSCGHAAGLWSRFVGWLRAFSPNISAIRYCAGGKAPTEDQGMMAEMLRGQRETFNPLRRNHCAAPAREVQPLWLRIPDGHPRTHHEGELRPWRSVCSSRSRRPRSPSP